MGCNRGSREDGLQHHLYRCQAASQHHFLLNSIFSPATECLKAASPKSTPRTWARKQPKG
eukprot:6601492-Prymnesium_polylepis.1